MKRVWLGLWLTVVASVVNVAHAFPTLRVRAEVNLTTRIDQQAAPAALIVKLVDDLGVPLAQREIVVTGQDAAGHATSEQARITTGAQGEARVALSRLSTSPWALTTFLGDDYYEAGEARTALVAATSRIGLELRAPQTVTLGGGAVDIDVQINSREAYAGALVLRVTDELGRELAEQTSVPRGVAQARISLETQRLGGPGPGEIRVSVAESDGGIQLTQATRAITRIVATQTAAHFESGEEFVHVRGSVTRRDRVAMALATVSIRCDDALLATVTTQEDGTYSADVAVDDLEQACNARAEFEPTVTWILRSESPSVRLTPPLRVPPSAVVASAATLVLAAFLLWRWRRSDRPTAPQTGGALGSMTAVFERARLRSLLPNDRMLSVRVIDARSMRPLAQAQLRRAEDRSLLAFADESGRCTIELSAGRHLLLVTCADHADHAIDVTSPHRGEWSNAIARLDSLRERALDVMSVLSPEANAQATPREQAARLSGAVDDVKQGTAILLTIEDLAYSAQPLDAADVSRVEQAAQALRAASKSQKP